MAFVAAVNDISAFSYLTILAPDTITLYSRFSKIVINSLPMGMPISSKFKEGRLRANFALDSISDSDTP